MGLLQRICGVLNNKNGVNFKNTATKPFLGEGFNVQALNSHNLAQDTFVQAPDKKYATDSNLNEQNLALTQPVRFIRKYVNEETIKNAIVANPNIEKILKENGLKAEFNYENVNSIIMSHLIPTSKTAQKMHKKMGHNQNEAGYLYLTQAALLHDIGKGFIPDEILNKKGRLTPKERLIIELHNQLSYEILKTTNLNPRVAQLAYEHHDYNKNVKRNHENQALTISDVYCALKEDRPYKKPLSDIYAKTLLYDMGTKGNFDSRYITYLSA